MSLPDLLYTHWQPLQTMGYDQVCASTGPVPCVPPPRPPQGANPSKGPPEPQKMSPYANSASCMGAEDRSYDMGLGRLASEQLQVDHVTWTSYLVHKTLSLATAMGLGPLLVPSAAPVVCLDPLEGESQHGSSSDGALGECKVAVSAGLSQLPPLTGNKDWQAQQGSSSEGSLGEWKGAASAGLRVLPPLTGLAAWLDSQQGLFHSGKDSLNPEEGVVLAGLSHLPPPVAENAGGIVGLVSAGLSQSHSHPEDIVVRESLSAQTKSHVTFWVPETDTSLASQRVSSCHSFPAESQNNPGHPLSACAVPPGLESQRLPGQVPESLPESSGLPCLPCNQLPLSVTESTGISSGMPGSKSTALPVVCGKPVPSCFCGSSGPQRDIASLSSSFSMYPPSGMLSLGEKGMGRECVCSSDVNAISGNHVKNNFMSDKTNNPSDYYHWENDSEHEKTGNQLLTEREVHTMKRCLDFSGGKGFVPQSFESTHVDCENTVMINMISDRDQEMSPEDKSSCAFSSHEEDQGLLFLALPPPPTLDLEKLFSSVENIQQQKNLLRLGVEQTGHIAHTVQTIHCQQQALESHV